MRFPLFMVWALTLAFARYASAECENANFPCLLDDGTIGFCCGYGDSANCCSWRNPLQTCGAGFLCSNVTNSHSTGSAKCVSNYECNNGNGICCANVCCFAKHCCSGYLCADEC